MNEDMTEETREEAESQAAVDEAEASQSGGTPPESEAQVYAQGQEPEPTSDESDELTEALESTLDNLNASIERMEELVQRLESGEGDWEESVRLLSEANDLAMESSQQLDRAVQDVMYGSEEAGEAGGAAGSTPAQEKLPLDHEED